MSTSNSKDSLQRFLFPELGCRGEFVRLAATWQELRARADYPAPVAVALGEALAATALLSATIKFDGSLSLQISGDGAVSMLLMQARADGGLRGLAQFDRARLDGGGALFGAARLAITIETGKPPERYQGLVALESERLEMALHAYFERSEQLPTRLWLSADAEHCAGILLQRLPDAPAREDDWRRLCVLTDTIAAAELGELSGLELLRRLYHEESVQLLDSRALHFGCSCSQQRTAAMLRGLGEAEVRDILSEEGAVSVHCEFCNALYEFDAGAVERLFQTPDDTP